MTQPPPLSYAPSKQQLDELAVATIAAKKVRRAVIVAQISGWSIAVFALLTLIGGLFSLPAFLLGLGMSVVAVIELRGAKQLKALDLAAPRGLMLNQLAFAGILILYALYCLWKGPDLTELQQSADSAQLNQVLGDYAGLADLINRLVYFSVIVAALLGPGLTALYYRSREAHLRRYVTETPAWILDLQRSGMGL